MGLLTIILAAGQGTRMKSDKSKVLHKVGGQPMIQHVIDSAAKLSDKTVVVVGHQAEDVKAEIKEDNLHFVVQKEQLGTGHAVIQAREHIKDHQGSVLILYGDTPLLSSDTIRKLAETRQEKETAVSVLTAVFNDPYGYGRIIKDDNDNIIKIVEEKDADSSEKNIKEVNTGVYCFEAEILLESVDNIGNNNAQNEYYLTDTIDYISSKSLNIVPLKVSDNKEVIGVNDRVDLANAEKSLRQRINEKHMRNGVTIIDPSKTYIDKDVEIEKDTVIYPFTYLKGKTVIASECIIGMCSKIIDAKIGNKSNILEHCVIKQSTVKNSVSIGPFAYIRPGSIIEDEVKVGDFVELKNALIEKGAKIPHLSYVGDAEVGSRTNIGAGTIFANYDGENKHKTTVGKDVFIGSNSTLVAPVNIGDKGKTGAGSVVTRDIPEGMTVLGVPARKKKRKKGRQMKS